MQVMYMKLIIWTAEMKSNEGWSSQLWTQLKKPEKKFRTSTGFEPVTSRYRCDALINYEATDVGSRSIVGSYVPVKVKNASDIYEINHNIYI